ncbi:hypothetical protein MNBD_NITROSPIRAE01-543 [hydrothermal vent metagenome]|uniref:Inverse autotransporter beta-domain domain-containing protein n=1 Tax=hydrothermal vent metagenome TaxID=652676 RepID=A0A3B1CSL9_9ZZZZ
MNSEKAALYIPAIFLMTLLFAGTPQVFAQETGSAKKWGPKFSLEYRPDRSRSLARFDALVPLWQKTNALVYSDLRYIDVSGTGFEGNLGLGYRKLQHNLPLFGGDWIWGAYGFFDRRKTSFENYFSQWTLGTELLTPNWSLRANGYFPETTGYIVGTRPGPGGGGGPTLSGTTVVAGAGSTTIVDKEWALPGFDVEVGYGIKTIPDHVLWLYAGYFKFDRSETAEISGPRVRFEYRMQNLLDWKGSEITFGAEIRDDDIGGTDGLVLARLRIPIGKKLDAPAQGFERKMTEFVQRDVDVVTLVDIAETRGAGAPPIIVDPDTGEPLNVYIVNNDGTGDCTQNNPCRISDVEADSSYGTGDVIVLVDSSGNIVGDIDLTTTVGSLGSDRRQVVGVGNDPEGNIVLTLSSGDQLNLNGLGARPTLEGTLTLANESQIRGFDIVSPGTAITGNGVNGVQIRDINVVNAQINALRIEGLAEVSVSDFSVQQVGGDAIDLSGTSGEFDFNMIDISGLGNGTGLNLNGSSANVGVNTLNITGTGAEGSTGVDMGGATGTLSVTNAGTIQNVVTGFDFDANSNATLNYQNGIINAGIPVNTVGVINGEYNFIDTTFIKDNNLSLQTGFGGNMYFVDATGNGLGTPDNPTSADFVETNATEGDIIFLVEEGGTGNIFATEGLVLRNNQQLLGFAAGDAIVDFTGVNPQFQGRFAYTISDPTGNGSATLSNNGGAAALLLASDVQVRDFSISTVGESDGIFGENFTNANIQNIQVTNAGSHGIKLVGATGSVRISDSSFVNAFGEGLEIIGGDAEIRVENSVILDSQTNQLIDIADTSGGSIRFDAATTISTSNIRGIRFTNIQGDLEFNGPVDIQVSSDAGVTATGLGTSTVSFNDRLDIKTRSGSGLIVSGGILNIAGGSIAATGGTGITASNTTVDIILDSLSATDGTDGLNLTNVTGTITILDRTP